MQVHRSVRDVLAALIATTKRALSYELQGLGGRNKMDADIYLSACIIQEYMKVSPPLAVAENGVALAGKPVIRKSSVRF